MVLEKISQAGKKNYFTINVYRYKNCFPIRLILLTILYYITKKLLHIRQENQEPQWKVKSSSPDNTLRNFQSMKSPKELK